MVGPVVRESTSPLGEKRCGPAVGVSTVAHTHTRMSTHATHHPLWVPPHHTHPTSMATASRTTSCRQEGWQRKREVPRRMLPFIL